MTKKQAFPQTTKKCRDEMMEFAIGRKGFTYEIHECTFYKSKYLKTAVLIKDSHGTSLLVDNILEIAGKSLTNMRSTLIDI